MPESLEQQEAYLRRLPDESIDFSDIPQMVDHSGFINVRRYVDPSKYQSRLEAYEAAVAARAERRRQGLE